MATFTCYGCGALCITPVTDEEVLADYEERTGDTDVDIDELETLCDKCNEKYQAWLRGQKGN